MADDRSKRDEKLTQYLTEAYAKEKELETALEAHIGMTTQAAYKKRLREHLRETKGHARSLEKRIKQVSGAKPGLAAKAAAPAAKAKSAAKGPMHALRGTGEAEKMLKNAKTEYFNEHEEIANYTAIATLAKSLRDSETEKLARSILRDEERMARFLERQIQTLTREVVKDELRTPAKKPAAKKKPAARKKKAARKKPSAKRKASARRR